MVRDCSARDRGFATVDERSAVIARQTLNVRRSPSRPWPRWSGVRGNFPAIVWNSPAVVWGGPAVVSVIPAVVWRTPAGVSLFQTRVCSGPAVAAIAPGDRQTGQMCVFDLEMEVCNAPAALIALESNRPRHHRYALKTAVASSNFCRWQKGFYGMKVLKG